MSKARQLIAGLAAQGALDSEGGFSLDRHKARDKMRQFQLANPHRYVLMLVEAAALKKAPRIDFEIETAELRASFAGRPFTVADFEELYMSMFVDRTNDDVAARRELAIGLNAVMALNPKEVVVRTGDGTTGASITLVPGREDVIVPIEADAPKGTTIEVHERFRPGLVFEFFRHIAGTLAEEVVLKDACRHASRLITVDGEQINQGLPDGLVASVEFGGDKFQGIAGFTRDLRRQAELIVLSNGVRINAHPLVGVFGGFVAVVDSSGFRKDVAQADVAKDELYKTIHRQVKRQRNEVVAALARAVLELDVPPDRPSVIDLPALGWRPGEVHDVLWSHLCRAGSWERLRDGRLSVLADLPMWVDVAGASWTTRALAEAHPKGEVPYVQTRPMHVPEGHEGTVLVGEHQRAPLEKLFEKAKPQDGFFKREAERARNMRKWRSRRALPKLGRGGNWLARTALEDTRRTEQKLVGEVGIGRRGQGTIDFLLESCLLFSSSLPPAFAGVVAVVDGPFTARKAYDAAHRNDVLADAMFAVLRGVGELMDTLSWKPSEYERVRTWLRAWSDPDFGAMFLTTVGFAPGRARRHVGRVGLETLQPRWDPAQYPDSALVHVPLFHTLEVDKFTIQQVASLLEEEGRIGFIPSTLYPVRVPGRVILQLDEKDRKLLETIFGADVLVDETTTIEHERAKQAFEQRPMQATSVANEGLAFVTEFQLGPVRGVLGFRPHDVLAGRESLRVKTRMLRGGRFLCDLTLKGVLPSVRACVDDPAVATNATWDGVPKDGRIHLERAIAYGTAQAVLAAAGDPLEVGQAVMQLAIRRLFPSPEYAQVYEDIDVLLGENADPETRVRLLRTAHRRLKKGERKIDVSTLEPAPDDPADRHGWFIHVLVGGWPAIERSWVFPDAARGAGRSIADFRQLARDKSPIDYVDVPGLEHDGEERTVSRLDTDQRATVRRILGKGAHLRGCRGWLMKRAQQRRFQSRPTVERVELPKGAALAEAPIVEEGLEGVVGVPAAWTIQLPTVDFYKGRRHVQTLDGPAHVFPFLGAVNDDTLRLNDAMDKVLEGPATKRAFEACRAALPAAFAQLAEKWDALNEDERGAAFTRVLRYLSERGRKALDELASSPEKGLGDLQGLVTIGGARVSLNALRKQIEAGENPWFVSRAYEGRTPPDPSVLRVEPRDLSSLERVLPDLRNYGPTWRAQDDADRNRASAPTLADVMPDPWPPTNALARKDWEGQGLRAVLAVLPRGESMTQGVACAQDGRVVEIVDLASLLPVVGHVESTSDSLADMSWSRTTLTERQRSHLREAIVEMYAEVVARIEEGNWRGTARQGHMRDLVLKLNRRKNAGQRLFPQSVRRLYRRMLDLPLFPVDGGGRLSLKQALAEQPAELLHLGLWEPPSAPVPGPESHAGTEATPPLAKKKERRKRGPPASAGLGTVESPVMADEPQSSSDANPQPAWDGAALVDRVRQELALVRGPKGDLISDQLLRAIRHGRSGGRALFQWDGTRLELDLDHDVAKRALEHGPDDPVWISLIASSAFSRLNVALEVVTDDHELVFHHRHARHLLSGTSASSRYLAPDGESTDE